MKWIKEHKGWTILASIVIFFFLVKYDYVKKQDVSDGFHAAVDLTKEIGEFAKDVFTGGNEIALRKKRADDRLDKHLDSLIHKPKRKVTP